MRRRPAPALRGYVLRYSGFSHVLERPSRRLEVPAGCITIVIGFGEPMRLTKPTVPHFDRRLTSLVCGMQTTATEGESRGRLYGIEITMTPLAAHTLLAIPMSEISDQILDLEDVLGSHSDFLVERLAELSDWESRFALVDSVLTDWLIAGPQTAPEIEWAWRELRRSCGGLQVERLAEGTGWSRRHLERRFREQVGLTPKALAQVLRLHEALRLQEIGLSWSEIAVRAGYYDQAHLDRAIRSITGRTPSKFRAERMGSPVNEPIDRIAGQVTSVVLPS